MEETLKRASSANIVEDGSLKVKDILILPVKDSLADVGPGELALGPDGLILKHRSGNTVDLGEQITTLQLQAD